MYLTPKESEYMGMKYHLGHTGYVNRDNQSRMFLTHSSIRMNKLQDMAHALENIEFKLK